MADIELVIKISEKAYNALTHTEFDASLVVDEMRKAIANGAPLPKEHGKLIDADAFLEENKDYTGWILCSDAWGWRKCLQGHLGRFDK